MALTASASLKLDKVLNMVLVAFKRRLAPITQFSTRFQAGELPRDHMLQVPFIPLESLASHDFDYEAGYVTDDFNVESRGIPVNKRKYQSLQFTTKDLLGLPAEVLAEAMVAKADKLAADVTADIFSIITAANFGASVLSLADGVFDADSVADLAVACGTANWPTLGRQLVVDEAWSRQLLKDPALRNAQASGSTATLRDGTIGRVSGFDVTPVPNLPTNGERLKGIAAFKYGILIASAPMEPTEEVKRLLSDYRLVTDEQTGLTLVYRAWGDPNMDNAKKVIEIGYGYALGDANQIKRLDLPAPVGA